MVAMRSRRAYTRKARKFSSVKTRAANADDVRMMEGPPRCVRMTDYRRRAASGDPAR
jgi:hypothetical protein